METGTAVLIVTVEIDSSDDEEFNRWYDEEHLPEKLAEPGFVAARRFKSHDEDNKYLVIYELEEPGSATKPAYLRKEPSQWSKDIMARWKDWSRSVWVQLPPSA